MTDDRALPILFVHHRSELGGAPASLAYLIRELDRARFRPHAYCPPGPAAELFRSAGAEVHPGPVAAFTHIWASTYRGRRWLLLARELARLPGHLRRFSRTLRSVEFALVHLNDSPPVAAAWLARGAGVPVLWHLRSALPESTGAWRSRALRATIRRLSAGSVAINEDVAASFGVGSAVVPNSVDLERFRPGDARQVREALGLPADRPVVSTFGFLYPSKGFRAFLGAAAALRARGIEASYLLVGGGVRDRAYFATAGGRLLRLAGLVRDHEADARQLARDLGVDDIVRFLSYVDDTSDLYRASDVVVAPSDGPELGRSTLEAAACGVPVVATGSRTGGGIVVPGETGLLAASAAEAIADAVAELLQDPERARRLGAAARLHAEQRFDAVRNARAIEDLYDRLLGSPARRGAVAAGSR